MARSARRFGLLTFVVLVCSLVAVQAQEALPQDSTALTQAFLEAALADQQADQAISTVVQSTSSEALSTSAARMSSEAARAQFWLPSGQASRTITVREGQSLWDIAVAWGITVETIAVANNLADANVVKPGQRLLIPVADDPAARAKVAANAARSVAASAKSAPSSSAATSTTPRTAARASRRPAAGALTVRLSEGQTVWSLARAHGTSVDAIVAANGLRSADRVRAGTRLVIPGRTGASRLSRVSTMRAGAQRAGEAFTNASTGAVRIARGFLWPARGQLTSRFGWRRWRHHDGIDIAAPYGSPIYAARPGRVVFAGWYYAYGRAVIIDHGNGVQTLYGHASKLLASPGETVREGQLIARVGTSGRSTGPHLHFEVRHNGRAVDPMRYMD
jgi:murein DD-endopeptidase MepM/ murein hydrolase activator NlpD